MGSPPRMRGKLRPLTVARDSLRDHPRGCGENAGRYTPAMPVPRITPADAGKTLKQKRQYAVNEDHPRGCGENVKKKLLAPYTAGSPPRMRGKLENMINGTYEKRITPADAGKTRYALLDLRHAWDHPRGCGENATPRTRISAKIGSPPRMRGKHIMFWLISYKVRITPADAGKTACT